MAHERTATKITKHGVHEIYVTSAGEFFADVDGGRIMAPTLEKLKAKLATKARVDFDPPLVVVTFGWRHEGGLMDVTAATAAGGLLMRDHGSTYKAALASRYASLYVYDGERLARRAALVADRERAEEALQALMDAWPEVTPETATALHAEQVKNPPMLPAEPTDPEPEED